MRLHRLTLRNFRATLERTVAFAERGVTVVEGPNEAGKSSLAEALDLLFGYQAHSRARAVRRVQPVGQDVATEVCVELSCGPYRLTYAKRFHREPATTLAVHEPAAEHLSGSAAHERVQAILAEHVDEALWRALRICQDVPLDQADLSEQTSLAAALDAAAGARVGGEREAALFERVVEEFERYHTPGGQPSKARRDLAAAVDCATAAVAEAEAALRDVEDDVARCEELARALTALAPRVTRSRERAERADAAWRALERRQVDVDRLALAAERAAGEREQAADAVAQRAAHVERRAEAERAVIEARAAQERHAPAAEAAERDVAAAVAAVEARRAAVADARRTVRAREREVEALRDAETLAGLEERIGRIEAAEAAAARAAAALEGPVVDDDALAAIEEALADVHRARAVAEADAPRVRIRRLAPVAVIVDGEPAGDAESVERRVTATTTVRIGEVAEVHVDAGPDAHQRLDRVGAAERALADVLDRCGAADVAAARTAHRRRAESTAALARARRTLAELLGDEALASLRERRDACAARLPTAGGARDRPQGDAVENARRAAEAARVRLDRSEAALAAADAALRDARARRESLAEAAASLRVRAEAAEQALAEATSVLAAARRQAADHALAAALVAAERTTSDAVAAHRSADAHLAAEDPDGAQAARDAAIAVRDRLAKEQRALEDDLRDTRVRLGVRGEEGLHDRLADAQRRLDESTREQARVEARAAAARMLYEELSARRDDATRAYAAPLRDKLEGLGRIVYGGDFAVELGQDLRITRRTLNGVTLDFADLSTGAREQLALLGRLAVAALVARDGGVPLLLDDALGSSDPSRLERLGAALRVGARDAQVIALTCVPDRYRTIGDATVVRLS